MKKQLPLGCHQPLYWFQSFHNSLVQVYADIHLPSTKYASHDCIPHEYNLHTIAFPMNTIFTLLRQKTCNETPSWNCFNGLHGSFGNFLHKLVHIQDPNTQAFPQLLLAQQYPVHVCPSLFPSQPILDINLEPMPLACFSKEPI